MTAREPDAFAILGALPVAVIAVAADWRVTYANAEGHRVFALADGTTLWERCPELEHTAFASGLRYAMSDRTELLAESALPPLGWCQLRAQATADGGLLIVARLMHAANIESGQAKAALLIGEIGDALTREDALNAAIARCAHAMVRHLDAALVRIWTIETGEDDEARALVMCGGAGIDPHDRLPSRLELHQHEAGRIAADGMPYLTNEAPMDPRVGGALWLQRERITAFAGYPLRVDDRIVGVMAMYSRRRIDHDLLNALSSIASALALGIDRKSADARRRQAEAALRMHAEQRETLYELGQQLAAELDAGVLAQTIVDTATRLAGAQLGAFLYDVVDGRHRRYAISGVSRERFARLPLPGPTALLAQTFVDRKIVRIDDLRAEHISPPDPHGPLASYLAVPVSGRDGRPLGSLVLGHERPAAFTAHTERLIANMAATAAVAMDNARLFKEARDLIAALEKSNRELDQFAYVASHDLKAPLRGIANLSLWIEEDLADRMTDQTRHHLELMRGRVVRLENLIAGILAYSRAGRDDGERGNVQVEALVHETWELLSPPASATLTLDGVLPTLTTSRTQLQQVLMNLISNAVKYNADRPVQIVVGCRTEGRRCEFFVRDDGVGIAPEFHDKIWGLFQTLERRDKLESTGIGLSIVRKIVEARGGRAWVESHPGSGATFRFTWATDPGGDDHG